MKYLKYILIIFALFISSNTFAQTVLYSNTGTPTSLNNGRTPFISYSQNTPDAPFLDNGTQFSQVVYHGVAMNSNSSWSNVWEFAVMRSGVKTNCISTETFDKAYFYNNGLAPAVNSPVDDPVFGQYVINFAGSDCVVDDNSLDYAIGVYIAGTTSRNTILRYQQLDNFWTNYTVYGSGEPQEQITLLYPQEDQSVSTPVTISGIYDNDGTFDQFGIDLYYTNDQNQLVNEFVWYSIPQSNNSAIPFSFPIQTVPDQAYEIGLSLNESGATNTYIGPTVSFDTFNLIAPNEYDDLECSSLLDWYCYGKRIVLWTFVPSQQTLNNFGTLTLSDKAPISYIYEIRELFTTLTDQSNAQNFEMTVSTPIGSITFINQQMIDDIPFLPFMRLILTAMIYFLGTWTLYSIARKAF